MMDVSKTVTRIYDDQTQTTEIHVQSLTKFKTAVEYKGKVYPCQAALARHLYELDWNGKHAPWGVQANYTQIVNRGIKTGEVKRILPSEGAVLVKEIVNGEV